MIEEDRDLLADWYDLEDYQPHELTPWLLRLILDQRLTVDKKLTMEQISARLKEEFDVSVLCVWCVWVQCVCWWKCCADRQCVCTSSEVCVEMCA